MIQIEKTAIRSLLAAGMILLSAFGWSESAYSINSDVNVVLVPGGGGGGSPA